MTTPSLPFGFVSIPPEPGEPFIHLQLKRLGCLACAGPCARQKGIYEDVKCPGFCPEGTPSWVKGLGKNLRRRKALKRSVCFSECTKIDVSTKNYHHLMLSEIVDNLSFSDMGRNRPPLNKEGRRECVYPLRYKRILSHGLWSIAGQ